jgi:DNA-binding transcriptional MerR regulator
MEHLGIGEVAELTGIGVGTLRMWEQRHGFPVPQRTASGHRRYASDDVEVLRSALALKSEGLTVPAALERARSQLDRQHSPSLYGAIMQRNGGSLPGRRLRKRTLIELSRAIEDEALAQGAAPICFGAFQKERFYRGVEPRWRALGAVAEASVVFADFAEARSDHAPAELPIVPSSPLGNEWSVVIDCTAFSAMLVAWELHDNGAGDEDESDLDRCFESYWSLDPVEVRAAARVGAALARDADEELGDRIEALLAERPLAFERPAVSLTALTNRVVSYLDETGVASG